MPDGRGVQGLPTVNRPCLLLVTADQTQDKIMMSPSCPWKLSTVEICSAGMGHCSCQALCCNATCWPWQKGGLHFYLTLKPSCSRIYWQEWWWMLGLSSSTSLAIMTMGHCLFGRGKPKRRVWLCSNARDKQVIVEDQGGIQQCIWEHPGE